MLPILFALTIIVLLFIVVIAGQPDEFKLTRSTSIAAPPEKVFPHVNDFHKWEAWSPWAKLDPACKNAFEGAAAGTGDREAIRGIASVKAARGETGN